MTGPCRNPNIVDVAVNELKWDIVNIICGCVFKYLHMYIHIYMYIHTCILIIHIGKCLITHINVI